MPTPERKIIWVPQSLHKDLNKDRGNMRWRIYLRKLYRESLAYRQMLEMTRPPPQKRGPKPKGPRVTPRAGPTAEELALQKQYHGLEGWVYCPEAKRFVKEDACERCPQYKREACKELKAEYEG